ncbi:MAG: homoserine O-acetyltransferase [Acidimicrobiaceae bacterium]|nr:homoserine O-acetyltransferase [Acidimicrobiaceae bacterium]
MTHETTTSARSDLDVPVHPRAYSADLPVTGAWRPGDPPGRRRFIELGDGRPFTLEGGASLSGVTLAYETWGELSPAADNAVLVCHALTGDSHVRGESGDGHPSEGWWHEVVGPGLGIDTDRHFVVCVNALGGCQGTTGPASDDPATGQPYGSTFPTVTTRDLVRSQAAVADHLGIDRWLAVVGGSMGGMQVLEWGVMYPHRTRALAPIATTLAASAQQVAWSAIGRTALALDPRFRGGDYYDAEPGDGPFAGLAIARSIAQVTYRSSEVFDDRFRRELFDPRALYGKWDRFQVESYLDHHGEKLVRRFDANSYLVLNRVMDLHDLARDRGSMDQAVRRLAHLPCLTVSISSDTLYPRHQQVEIRDAVRATGGRCDHYEIQSPDGHDGFLLAQREVGTFFDVFLREVEAS